MPFNKFIIAGADLPVSGVFFEAQTMIGRLLYATIELSITATT